ncbi:MAG TPA: hypothetical protein QGF02_00855 [Candidatus Babeliales bacterium]|nr:hypothetical protein [Candidatus Babeliales bacterium]
MNKLLLYSLYIVVIGGLVGCGKQKIDVDFQQHEARFSDIPIPFQVTPLRGSTSRQSCAFILDEGQSDSFRFYKLEMERMGWKLISEFQGFEAVLVFEKLQRICNISIRPTRQDKDDSVQVVIIQMNKFS